MELSDQPETRPDKQSRRNKIRSVLIAGGTGLIGRELGKRLAAKGYQLTVLTRGASAPPPCPCRLLSYKEALSCKEQARKLFQKTDAVINLAGANIASKRWTKKRKEELCRSRIDTTRRLARFSSHRTSRVRCFISASGAGFYRPSYHQKAVESASPGKGFLARLCQEWERPVQELPASVRHVIFRIAPVFSEKGGFLGKITAFLQVGLRFGSYRLTGAVAGNGRQLISWIDIEDLVRLFLFALEKESVSGVFNAAAPVPVSNKELTKDLARRFRADAVFSLPAFFFRLVFGEAAELILDSRNLSSQKTESLGFRFRFPHWRDSLDKRLPQRAAGKEKRLRRFLSEKFKRIFKRLASFRRG